MLTRIAALVAVACVCVAQDTARMEEIIQSYVANRQFMGTALVARGNDILLNKGYGSANLEWDIPNTPSTKFRLGSVTKQFTAAAILLLEQREKLNVNDPVKKHIPNAPAAWNKITVFHLLTHTAGLPNFTGFPEYGKLTPYPATPAELVARFRDKPLEFEPGEKWNYSNSGYLLLGHIIETITGGTYETFVRENIFMPLEMKDSGYDSNSAIIPRRAIGYTAGPNGFQHAGFIHMTIPHAAGALYSTTGDLLKWQQGLYGGKLLTAASLEKMTKPFKSNYAMGLTVEMSDGRKTIQHGGGIEGFNTELAYYPDNKLTVVVLGNVNGAAPSQIAKALAAVAQGGAVKLQSERKEIKIETSLLSRLAGAYQMQPGLNLLITLDGNQLYGKLGNQPSFPVFPEAENLFFYKVVDAQLEFPKGSGDSPATQVTLHQNGRDMTGQRLGDTETKALQDAAAAAAKRIQDQTPAPGSEAALRKLIEGLRTGKPDYESMSAALATATRQQLSGLQSSIAQLGAVQSMTFKSVGPAGPDIYEVKFDKGSLEYRIWLAPDGTVESALVRPLP